MVESPVGVDENDAGSAVQEDEVDAHLSDGASYPGCHSVSFSDRDEHV